MDLDTAKVGPDAPTQVAAQAELPDDTSSSEDGIYPTERYQFIGSKEDFEEAAEELFDEGKQDRGHLTNTASSLTQTPRRLLPTRLRNYQMEGVGFLCQQVDHRACALLADDKGLGKTIELIALMLERPVKPNLIVCPASLTEMWIRELQTRVQNPPFNVLHLDDANDAKPTVEYLKSFDVVVCSFPYLEDKCLAQRKYRRALDQQATANSTGSETSRDQPPVHPHAGVLATHWGRVIVDEAHAICKPFSLTNVAVCDLKSDQRIACTATPMEDGFTGIGALLNFLRVVPWGDLLYFFQYFVDEDPNEYTMGLDQLRHEQLVLILRSLMLRRLASQYFDGFRIQDMLNP